MGEEKEILLRGKVCAYLTDRLMGDTTVHRCSTPIAHRDRRAFGSAIRDKRFYAR